MVFRMICVANVFKYKGHEDLMAAIKLIGPALPEPWLLTLVGRGTERFNGAWRVRGVGYCPYIRERLANSDLFILPSHEEGCSNALLEAMACGVPVIATDIGGNKDAIIHGNTGLLVPPSNQLALGQAIIWMAAQPERRKRMADRAKADVAKRFSFNRCIDDYEALYRSALKGA
jgi:glycosyltransferase involved in cell wall biosynthesis